MKKICIVLGVICLMIIVWFLSAKITRAELIKNIKIDGVNEVDNGIITLEINGEYYDYEYEYKEGFKTLQERINNGEIENITIDEIKSNGKDIKNALVTMNILGQKFNYYMEK